MVLKGESSRVSYSLSKEREETNEGGRLLTYG